jgi:hypothetical protein
MHISSYYSKGKKYYRILEGKTIVMHLGSANKVKKVFEAQKRMVEAKFISNIEPQRQKQKQIEELPRQISDAQYQELAELFEDDED